jgi:hypothetical protein
MAVGMLPYESTAAHRFDFQRQHSNLPAATPRVQYATTAPLYQFLSNWRIFGR